LLGGSTELRLAFERSAWQTLSDGLSEPMQITDELCPWPLLAAGQRLAINLAQGEFSIRQDSGKTSIWRTVAGMAGLWLVLQLGFDMTQSWTLQRQGDHQAAASRALYQQLFPEDTRIVNLKAQFDEHLSQATEGQQGQFFGLLHQAARALGDAPQLRVQQLDFSQERGDLALQLQADDFASLEQFRRRLAEDGLQVQLGSANREAQGVSARLVIGGGA
jgi:general secretion pathway protein L